MSKSTTSHDAMELTMEGGTASAPTDILGSLITVPVTKLDADDYIAHDLDGFTESLLGSGNLNFLMMQAGQTDGDLAASTGYYQAQPEDMGGSNSAYAGNIFPNAIDYGDNSAEHAFSGGHLSQDGTHQASSLNHAQANHAQSDFSGSSNGNMFSAAPAAFPTGASGTGAASSFSPANGAGGAAGTNGRSGQDGNDGQTGQSGNNGSNGNNGSDGNNGSNGNNGGGEGGNHSCNECGDVTEIINNITETVINVTNITNNLTGNVTNIITDVTEISHTAITNVTESITGDLLADLSLDIILDPFQYDGSSGDIDLSIGTDITLLELNLPLPGVDVPLDPVEALMGDIDIDLDAGEILAGIPLLGGAAQNGDTNIALEGITDIPALSPVTGLVDSLFNHVEDIAGDIDVLGKSHIDLLNLGQDTDNGGADTDIVLPQDLNITGNDFVENALSVSLDPVEALIGDIDLDLGIAADLFGVVADNLIDSLPGGTGTENILSGAGDMAGNLAGTLLPFGNAAGGDTDLSLGGDIGLLDSGLLQDSLHTALDPVESLTGDLDIAADLGLNLLSPDDFQSPGDTDLTLNLDLTGSILPAPPLQLDLNLDALESIAGDIDIALDITADLLALNGNESLIDQAIGLIDALPVQYGGLDLGAIIPGGGGQTDALPSWTESVLPNAQNMLGDGLLGNVFDNIADPVTSLSSMIAPEIPVLPALPAGGGNIGGIFGNGGLFG